jgi:hypothetical protein
MYSAASPAATRPNRRAYAAVATRSLGETVPDGAPVRSKLGIRGIRTNESPAARCPEPAGAAPATWSSATPAI